MDSSLVALLNSTCDLAVSNGKRLQRRLLIIDLACSLALALGFNLWIEVPRFLIHAAAQGFREGLAKRQGSAAWLDVHWVHTWLVAALVFGSCGLFIATIGHYYVALAKRFRFFTWGKVQSPVVTTILGPGERALLEAVLHRCVDNTNIFLVHIKLNKGNDLEYEDRFLVGSILSALCLFALMMIRFGLGWN